MIAFLLFVQFSIFAAPPIEITSKTFLEKAHAGDYIAAESGKMLTLILIRSIDSKTVVLEEISAPLKNGPRANSWAKWIKDKAPGHSSWSILTMDLESGQILECYSFSRNTHIQISQKESLLATLLHLPLKTIRPQDRRRIGPPPLSGESDVRKFWQPPLVFEGKRIKNPQYNVFETTWPNDGSEIDGRQVTLYFDVEMRIPLPVWIDVATSHATGRFHVVDSGKNLISQRN